MDPGAMDAPVTLVIKAPNQKYEDQTINCFLNWTVKRLKCHISNVYPSKPLSKDQRLVYSGQLLQDHVQLGDVLRKQDEYHMMHLVCASLSPPSSPQAHSPPMDGSAPTANSSDSSSSSSLSQDAPSSDSDGLRYRGLPPYSGPGLPQWPGAPQGGPQGPLQGALPGNTPPQPMYMPMQMLWWQQMYARHYYLQYQAAVAAAQAPSPAAPSAPSASPPPPQPEPAVQPPLGPNPLPENQPAVNPNLQVNPNIQMNAQGGAVLNEDELNRDWLDWLYTVSRAGVLLSIVYFYSSFSRFVMVLGAMLLVYLHQAGWFPFRAEQQPLRAERRPAAPDEADPQQDMQEMERLMDEGLDDDTEEAVSDRARLAAAAAAAAPDPGFLTTAWAFISTFFTSLIPEGRGNQAN